LRGQPHLAEVARAYPLFEIVDCPDILLYDGLKELLATHPGPFLHGHASLARDIKVLLKVALVLV